VGAKVGWGLRPQACICIAAISIAAHYLPPVRRSARVCQATECAGDHDLKIAVFRALIVTLTA
jgi:hypothetical protein